MLESFYATLFNPRSEHLLELSRGVWVLLLVSLLFAMLLAAGYGPLMLLAIACLLAGIVLILWLSFGGTLMLADRLLGGEGSGKNLLLALAEASWPLLLIGPAVAFGRLLPWVDGIFVFLAWGWSVFALMGKLSNLEGWSGGRSAAAIALALLFFFGGIGVLVLFPVILGLLLVG